MFDKKYKQGMKDGAKPFKDIDSETAKEVQKTADELHRENMKMLGVIRDFIDYQNMPDKDKAAFVERLKEMQKQGKSLPISESASFGMMHKIRRLQSF